MEVVMVGLLVHTSPKMLAVCAPTRRALYSEN